MQLCVSTLACPAWDLATIIRQAAAAGINGVDFRGVGSEIDITKLPEFGANLDQTLSMFAQHQLSMPCLNTSVTLVCNSPQRWEAMLDEARRYAQLAQKTGTRFLRIFCGELPKELTAAEGLNMAKRHLRQIIKICSTSGCSPLLETHDQRCISSEVLELIGEFDPAEVGVLWDLEHPWRRGETPIDTANGLRKFLRHVHVKDSTREGTRNHPQLLGEGELPLAECAEALRSIDYQGWYCLETEKRWEEHAPEPEVSLPQFVSYMRNRWGQ